MNTVKYWVHLKDIFVNKRGIKLNIRWWRGKHKQCGTFKTAASLQEGINFRVTEPDQ